MSPGFTTSSPPSERRSGSLLAALGFGRRSEPAEAAPTRPSPRALPLDDIREVFWDAYSYLFPRHALVRQNENGALLISWSLVGDPHATYRYASPVMLRFEPELLELMRDSDAEQRKRIALHQEATLRAGLVGYDPYAGAQARIVVLG